MLLDIQNLSVSIDDNETLHSINLAIRPGEVHAIMGPNGSGKTTLAQTLAGRERYNVTQGSITLNGHNLLDLSIEERARAGVFLAFQYPVEIPGVNSMSFLKSAVNIHRKEHGLDEYDAMDFLKVVRTKLSELGIDESFLKRSVNVGFSGGEKKRFDILQMSLLEPTLAIMDETDSGLDIDALKTVAEGVNALRDANRGFLMITHYQRLLNYIEPDYVHILKDGSIIKSGGKELALELEQSGYSAFDGE